jgi:outer membrane protein
MQNPKLLAISALAVSLAASSAAHADTKVAVLDMQRAISETNEGARATDALKKLFDKRQVELDAKQNGMLKDKAELEKRCKSAPRADCEKGQEDLQKRLMELQGLMSQYQGEIQKKQGEATQPILGKMLQIIKRIALDKGFDVVIDRGASHWMRSDLDVTELAIKMYNAESNVPPLPPSDKPADKPGKGGATPPPAKAPPPPAKK